MSISTQEFFAFSNFYQREILTINFKGFYWSAFFCSSDGLLCFYSWSCFHGLDRFDSLVILSRESTDVVSFRVFLSLERFVYVGAGQKTVVGLLMGRR